MSKAAPLPGACLVCGCAELRSIDVLPAALVADWELSPTEAAYINRQQGLHCVACGSTLRCMVLAAALLSLHGSGPPLARFVDGPAARALRVLEINAAGGLSPFLARLPMHTMASFPTVDMMQLPYPDAAFDLVVHSDTLEHVPSPLAGLAECRRVLRPGGACAFTVPMVVGRLTRSRQGLPDTWHGAPGAADRYLVHTEFGSDAWRYALEAGFAEVRLSALDPPSAHALVALR